MRTREVKREREMKEEEKRGITKAGWRSSQADSKAWPTAVAWRREEREVRSERGKLEGNRESENEREKAKERRV